MANSKQALKQIRRTERRTAQNSAAKARIKTLEKNVLALAKDGKKDEAAAAYKAAASALDKGAKVNLLHKGSASRRKSRLAKSVNAAAS